LAPPFIEQELAVEPEPGAIVHIEVQHIMPTRRHAQSARPAGRKILGWHPFRRGLVAAVKVNSGIDLAEPELFKIAPLVIGAQ
jgi:hypothetical protein